MFTTETVLAESTIHCREFCPAVGMPEAPASGTTNRALACYLLQQGLLDAASESQMVIAEQGYEIDKPSRICTELTLQDGQAIAVKVGGVATKVLQGSLYIN